MHGVDRDWRRLELAQHDFELARSQLAAYKVPRYFEIVTELPHTPTGRLAKHQLDRGRTPDEIDFEPASRQSR